MEIAIFGAGCFWGVEATFAQVEGVLSTSVGYAGGSVANPTYQQVCLGGTGHSEVVRVEFDPAKVSYEALLDVFWSCHDPTQLNRQGPDFGYQYRSVVFCEDARQLAAAEASKGAADASGRYLQPVCTAIEPSRNFYLAEEYHQKYLAKKGLAACHA
ncbi:MAG: peptide-methionine (S)-S-oxide reductase MsrA [Bryobacterales bacterium]|nr:peptide-methionine (S)-S-oxide reductase MsrA [Bryobacterales bacterium]